MLQWQKYNFVANFWQILAMSLEGYVMKLFNLCVLSLATALLGMGLANANYTVYKTIGAHGEVKYMQIQPNSGNYETLQFRQDGRTNTPGEMAPTAVSATESAEQNRIAELQKQVDEMQSRENAQRCATLRNNLANLNMGTRVYENDAQGGRTFLTDQQIIERRARIQQNIAEFCQ